MVKCNTINYVFSGNKYKTFYNNEIKLCSKDIQDKNLKYKCATKVSPPHLDYL